MSNLKELWEHFFGPTAVLGEPGFDPTVDPIPSHWFGKNSRGGISFRVILVIVGALGLGAFFLVPLISKNAEAAKAPKETQTVTPLPTWTATPPGTATALWTSIPSVTPYATPFGQDGPTSTPPTVAPFVGSQTAFGTAEVFVTSVVFTPALTANVDPTQTPWIIYRTGGGGGNPAPLPTYTPYPPQVPWPTYTPLGALPSLTPRPTYTPWPTYTPLARTATAYPTLTPWPTYTARPTLTPWPTLTPYPLPGPSKTPPPTVSQTPWLVVVTATGGPTQTPWVIVVTATPSDTPTPTDTATATSSPTPTATDNPTETETAGP